MEKDEGMAFWLMLSYPDIFNFLMFYSSEPGSKDLSDYEPFSKNCDILGY